MIRCTVCDTQNDDLSIICSSCKSFLQGRVDALNLFSTIWGLVEHPRSTFKRIVLAKHKNYSLLLSALLGINVVFDIAWYKDVADRGISVAAILGTALIAGPMVGIVVTFMGSFLLQQFTRAFGGRATLRNLFAAMAYAGIPMVLSLVFLVPLELGVFGALFFGTNPPPRVAQPIAYDLMLGLKAATALWMLILVVEGTMAANAFARSKIIPVAVSVIGLAVAGVVSLRFLRF